MSQLMKILFSVSELSGQMEAEAQAVKASAPAVQTAQERLTREEFDQLWNAILDIGQACDLDTFTLGFRMGVQLVLEGLRPIQAQE